MIYFILLSPLVGYLIYHTMQRWRASRQLRRRQALMAAPFDEQWRQVLRQDFALYARLPAELQRRLEGLVLIFLDEKVFLGRNGFEMTDRARLLVAAQACLLILNQPGKYYPGFETILIYPETYVAEVSERDGWIQTDRRDHRAGESWHRGPVILAWNHVLQGGRDSRDGHNVVMHEFAHKLDEENYVMDGLPILQDGTRYRSWAEVLSREFEHLRQHGDDVIDAYGATSAAEFFAVVTEVFFEKPEQLKYKHPQLYAQFKTFYQLDPAAWPQH